VRSSVVAAADARPVRRASALWRLRPKLAYREPMKRRLSIGARWRKFGYLLGPRREIRGLELRVLLPDKGELATTWPKCKML
jgi:hypothetical protein